MSSKLNLVSTSLLRGFQMLFAIVVIGLSTTLLKNYDNRPALTNEDIRTSAPHILPMAIAVGCLSLVAAIFNLAVAWTQFLREYIEFLVDVAVIFVNIIAGSVSIDRRESRFWCQGLTDRQVLTFKIRGRNCGDTSWGNRFGSHQYPFIDSLAGVDILRGVCQKDAQGAWYCANVDDTDRQGQLNLRCKQSQTDCIFMFLTVVVLAATLALAFLRARK
jgi:hypothetical protein